MKVKHGSSRDGLLLFKLVANAFGCTFAFLPTLKPKQKMQKSHQANTQQNRHRMTTKQTTEKEGRRHNITYTQAGVPCFVRQESGIFEVQFFVGSSVVKIPACV